MSTTDEERVAAIAEGVDDPKGTDEPEDNTGTDDAEDEAPADDSQDDAANADSDDSAAGDDGGHTDDDDSADDAPSFTKKYPNVKGDDPESYSKNLETAYENSTAEALRLKKELEDSKETIEEAKKIIAAGKADGDSAAAVDISTHPAIQRLERREAEALTKDFQEFRDDNPNINLDDVEEFKKFEIAVNNAGNTIRQVENREPTYREMFDKAADLLGWSESKADRVASAVKDGAAKGKTNSGRAPIKTGNDKVSDKQLAAARKMFPGKTDAELKKELAEYIS